jgi:hypothetical protein
MVSSAASHAIAPISSPSSSLTKVRIGRKIRKQREEFRKKKLEEEKTYFNE